MPEYLSPGVYTEEVDSGPKPIATVSTSTTGAVGVTERGPTKGRPQLITSFADFTRYFGSVLPEPNDPGLLNTWNDIDSGGHFWRFALAVKGFFDNGGQRMFVQRVTAKAALWSTAQLIQGYYLDLAKPAKAGDTLLKLSAGSGLLGIAKNSKLVLTTVDAATSETVTVASYDAGANSVTLTAGLVNNVAPLTWLVGVCGPAQIPVNAPPANVFVNAKSLAFTAASPGIWGNDVQIRVRPMVSASLRIQGNDGIAGNAPAKTTVAANGGATVDLASGTGFANNDHVLIANQSYVISGAAPQTAVATVTPTAPAIAAATNVFLLPSTPTTTAGTAAAGSLQVPTASGLANNDKVVVLGTVYTLGGSAVAGTNTNFTLAPPAAAAIPVGTAVYKVPTAAAAQVPTAVVAGANQVPLSLVLTSPATVVIDITNTVLTITQVDQVVRFNIVPNLPGAVAVGTWVVRPRLAVDPANQSLVFLSNTDLLYIGALLEFDNGTDKASAAVTKLVNQQVTLDTPLPTGTFFDVDMARLVEAQVEVRYQPDPSQPPTLETFQGLRLFDDQSSNYLVTHINDKSLLVQCSADQVWAAAQPDLERFPALGVTAGTPALPGGWVGLAGGDDKLGSLKPDDFVGEDNGPGHRSGICALDDVEEVSLLMAPGIWASDVRRALILHCEDLKDRFAILDPPPAEQLAPNVRTDPETIKAAINSTYGAIYYPWLIGRDFVARRNVKLPPSGHMAGIYARSDNTFGVHKAPANEEVEGIDSFELDITKREQDILNPQGVNALRYFHQRGYRVWGARTLSTDQSWKYLNVRRLFTMIERSIDIGLQWVVFMPNDEKLWARVRQTIGEFLEGRWREGMLMGTSKDEAFFIRCDRTTMSQDDIDNGRLIVVVGIAPVKPAEFVILRFQQKTLDQKA